MSFDFAEIDFDRDNRCGRAEVIYAQGKTADQVLQIARALLEKHGSFLCTRANDEQARVVLDGLPEANFFPETGILCAGKISRDQADVCKVAVVSAGTADQRAAGEAFRTLEFFGWHPVSISDVGVAGIHRLFQRLEEIRACDVLIVAAGMEGALPSVVGGLVKMPVIALPTSTGYGSGAHGIAALLAMLNSCASGITVVNIDNGFGAACAADSILRQLWEARCSTKPSALNA